MAGKDGPNRLANYLHVHRSCMADFLSEGFVVRDDCGTTLLPKHVLLEGPILCVDNITLDVWKEVGVVRGRGPTATVQTRAFRYHAWVRGNHNIFRYDSPHEHRPNAHKHVYDTFGSGGESELIELAQEDDVPTLAEVLRRLQTWHEQNASRLKSLR